MDKNHASDSDESDEDYCPDNDKQQVLSECDSESDSANSSEAETVQPQKRKSRQKRKPKKSPERDRSPHSEHELGCDESEESKKHADALWSDFLNDTKDSTNAAKPQQDTTKEVEKPNITEQTTSVTMNEKVQVTEIFEFAGEQVQVTKEVDATEAVKASPSPASSKKVVAARPLPGRFPMKRPGGGGLGAILGQINKKNKLSVLEKSKLDWDSFKAKEGLSEELKTHNKGKDGYLERQDFLQRADLRQFEQEREMRLNARRSKH